MNCCKDFENSRCISFEAGKWSVAGCCGGDCNVLDGIRFCPFCGEKLNSADTLAASTINPDSEDSLQAELVELLNRFGAERGIRITHAEIAPLDDVLPVRVLRWSEVIPMTDAAGNELSPSRPVFRTD